MESASAMDKKVITARCQLPSKNGSEPPLKDYGKKSGPQYARKRENERPEYGRKPVAGRGGRSGQRYVRPREKMGGQVESCTGASEVGSLYRAGGKKQNITHLMNWWGPGYRSHHSHGGGERGYQGSGARMRRYSAHTPKYSKEHFLQANCQFVVQEGEDYSVYSASPDLLVEWRLVEEVRLHVSEAPSCPICLHHPTAAKVTRCGHIYCFPCILHYLALSDEKWRKCPICDEPVDRDDLKSVIAICHKDFGIGEEIELQLMRRERDSLLPMPAASFTQKVIEEIPRIGSVTPATPYSKLLVASKDEVKNHILEREHRDLTAQLAEEGDQPEACFISEALTLLESRLVAVNARDNTKELTIKTEDDLDALSLSSPEEPSSCESLPSIEDPLSPLSLNDCKLQSPDEPPPPLNKMHGSSSSLEANDTEAPTVTVDDLDISQLQPGNFNSQGAQGQRNVPKSTFFFYQASNGAQIYMHSLNVKMLVQEYGSLENCPAIIKAKVLEKESASMTEDLRNRLRYLRHLPVSCSFDVVEVALGQPLLSKLTLSMFQEHIETRQRKRNKRAREERKIEKRVQAEQDRMLGRSKGATNMKINSFTQFPAFVDDFPSSAVTMVPEVATTGSSNPVGSEFSTSPTSDSLYGSSTDTNGTGVSFARMIREGQTKLPHSQSEPKSLGGGGNGTVWPTLGGSSNGRPNGVVTAVTSNKQGSWGMKQSASFSIGSGQQNLDDDCSEDDEPVAVPEFKHSFSDAIAQALDAAAKNAAVAKTDVSAANVSKKGKKKKQKQVLLFSSGGFN